MPDAQKRPKDPSAAEDAITSVSQVAYGFMGSQALFAALDLGLFTALEGGPLDAAALADKIGAQLDPLRSLLEALVALDLIEREGPLFRNTRAASRYLVQDARGYMGDYYLKQIAETLYHQMPDAKRALRGEAAKSYSNFLDDPLRTEAFIRGQHAGSAGPAYLLSRNPDLAHHKRLLDLGGGSGAFSIEAVRRNPDLSAIVFDQPQVTAFAEKFIAEEGFSERISCVPGDVLNDEWPRGADMILLSYVVSSYRPQALNDLLQRAFAYLPKAGGIYIHDFAMNGDRPGPRNAALWQFANLAISATTYPHRQQDILNALSQTGFVDVGMQAHIPDITFLFFARRP
ncbi:MAG: class I SAM-dependent methyltransferase [Pseudorhodoplanes sp.]